MEIQIFHHAKNIIFQKKNPLQETKKNPSRYFNSITNFKFQHKSKDHQSFKNPLIKIDVLLPGVQNL